MAVEAEQRISYETLLAENGELQAANARLRQQLAAERRRCAEALEDVRDEWTANPNDRRTMGQVLDDISHRILGVG